MVSAPQQIDEFEPATQIELARFVADNFQQSRRTLSPVGGRTSLHIGYPVAEAGISIPMTRLNQVIAYPARDMTITVEAGIRMEELSRILSEEGQRLPIDHADPHRATLGGLVATNSNGSFRYGLGTLRDYVIGISGIDASGRLFKAGGQVVKNVAGYDLCKLMIGSLGTLAVITQITLKVRPLPESTRWLWCEFSTLEDIEPALAKLHCSAARPVVLDALSPDAAGAIDSEMRAKLPTNGAVLCLAVEGTQKDTDWQIATLLDEIKPFHPMSMVEVDEAMRLSLGDGLTGFQTLSEEPVTFRASMLPSRTIEFLAQAHDIGIAAQAHAGNGIVIGHLPDEVANLQQAQKLLEPFRSLVRNSRGSLSIINCPTEWKSDLKVFGEQIPGWQLMRQLKKQLDPDDLLNRGRLFGTQ